MSTARGMGQGGRATWSRLQAGGPGGGRWERLANPLKINRWSRWSRWSEGIGASRYGHQDPASWQFAGEETSNYLDHLDHLDQRSEIGVLSGPGDPIDHGPPGPATLDLLRQLAMLGVELRVRGGRLYARLHGAPLDDSLPAELPGHYPTLQRLVDGSTCRWCWQPVDWHRQPDTLSLADGTSLHWACRAGFEIKRRTCAVAAHATDAVGAPDKLVDQSS